MTQGEQELSMNNKIKIKSQIEEKSNKIFLFTFQFVIFVLIHVTDSIGHLKKLNDSA